MTAQALHSPPGTLVITPLAPNVSLFVVDGFLNDALAQRLLEEAARISKDGGAVGLHHWWGMDGYSSAARGRLTQWMLTNRAGFSEVHILMRAGLVAMGVNVANLALGGFLRATSDPEKFEAVVARYRPSTR